MGEASSSTTKKLLTVMILVSLVALSSVAQFYAPNSTGSLQGGNSESSGGLGQSQQLASDPLASPRPVNESAIGFDVAAGTGRPVNLPSTGTNDLLVTLGYGWTGTRLYTTVTGLWDQKDWIRNGNFTSGSTSWSFWPHNVGSYSNPISSGWKSSGAPSNPGKVWARIDGVYSGGFYRYDGGDAMAWNQTVSIPRGTIISAKLEFRYYIVNVPMLNTLGANIYAWVGKGWAYNVSYPAMPSYGTWNYVSVDVPLSLITLPNVLLSLGHYQIGSYGYSALNYVNASFDDVRFTVKAYVKPEQVKLKLAAPGLPNTNCSIISPSPSAYGVGDGTLTGFTIGPAPLQTTYYFDFTSNVTSPTTGFFAANATIYVNRQKTAVTSFVNQGTNINWSVSLVTAFESYGQSLSTTAYTKYYYNVSLPSDWNLTTCKDPSGTMHQIMTGPKFANWTVGSIRILRVNVTYIASYSTPPNYYPYVIYALSNNYVKKVFTQLQSGPSWSNATNFYPQDTMKVVAYIAGASPVSSGVANLTIRGPPTYGASPVTIETQTGVTPVNGWANFTKTIPSTYVAGNYSAQVDWVDNSLGEAGSLTCAFNVTHRFRAVLSIPGDGDVILADSYIINPSSTAKIFDYHTNESITATVKGRASWEPPGTWNSYTYSPSNGTYTNTTHVGSLSAGTRAWIAINASKTFYDSTTVNNTVWIGQETTCTPASQSFTVRYTESASNNVKPSVTYLYKNGSVVPGATLTLLADISSNDSLIQWTQRSENDLSQSGSGVYSSKLYVGTLSPTLKGIPAGNTYTVWFKLTKGQYTQTRTFSARVTVLTQPTIMAYWGASEKTVFWGETAQYSLNFSTRLAGSFDWPTTMRIYNYSDYVPPYATVSCDWAYGWKVEESTFYRGTYVLSLYTSSYPTPTDDGTGQGTAQINVQFHKSNYDDPEAKLMTLHIRRLTTSMTGAVQNGAVYTPTNTTSVYPGDLKSIFVWYNDTHTGVSVGVGGSTITYTSSGGNILGSGTLDAVVGRPGLYNLTLSGATTNQIPGTYQIYLVGSNSPHYVQRSITVTLNILSIPSALQTQNPTVTIYYLDRVVFLIWYNDTHNNLPISGATLRVSTAPPMSIISPYEVPGVPGLYNLTIPRGQGTGSYSMTVSSNKTKYADGSMVLSLSINSLPTTLTPYTIAGDGSYLFKPNATVQIGGDLTIYLWFNDTFNQVPIPGVGTSITFTSNKFGNGWLQAVSGTPGLYELTVHGSDAGGWPITFTVNAPGYQSHTFVFTVMVQAPSGGFTVIQLAVMGFGSGGVVLAAVLGYVFVKRARVPFIIKKIDESLKLISKGDHEAATPVALRSREEIVVGITQERIDVFGRRPAGPEAAGEGVAEAAAVAPTPETSALKKELEAVEPKEKSGEAIEEVEMDTLDEELQKLEKFEDKEKLPDGAKEVRDVVEKYKQSKKKK